MHPILFKLPGFTLYTQTLLLLIAFVAGLLIAVHEGKRFAIPRLAITDVALWGFLCAVFGARLLFMLLTWKTSVFTVSAFFTLGTSDGGFSFHGGLIAGGLGGFAAARHHKLSLWRLADVLAPGLAIAMFFMRLGCLLNGCDYGIVTVIPWGIPLYGAPRHPIQIYEGVGNLLLLPLLFFLNKKPVKPGQVFFLYLFLSGLLRVGVDFYREEYARVEGLFTIPQLIAAGLALLALLVLFIRRSQRIDC